MYSLLLKHLDFPCVALHSLLSQVSGLVKEISKKLPHGSLISRDKDWLLWADSNLAKSRFWWLQMWLAG